MPIYRWYEIIPNQRDIHIAYLWATWGQDYFRVSASFHYLIYLLEAATASKYYVYSRAHL